jgi:acyl carrier protein
MTTIDAFLEELRATIENAEPATIVAEAKFRDLAWWDSLAALTTLAVVDSCYGRQISASELGSCETFADIHTLVSR